MSKLGLDISGHPIQAMRAGKTHVLEVSGESVSCGPFGGEGGTMVRIVSTVPCFYSCVGAATRGDAYLPADVVEYVWCHRTDGLSVVGLDFSGQLYVTEGR